MQACALERSEELPAYASRPRALSCHNLRLMGGTIPRYQKRGISGVQFCPVSPHHCTPGRPIRMGCSVARGRLKIYFICITYFSFYKRIIIPLNIYGIKTCGVV